MSFKYEAFLSYSWHRDNDNRDTHARVTKINERLRQKGIRTWFDQDELVNRTNLKGLMLNGINDSKVMVVFLTEFFVRSLEQNTENAPKLEILAMKKKKDAKIIYVALERCILQEPNRKRIENLLPNWYKECIVLAQDSDIANGVDILTKQIQQLGSSASTAKVNVKTEKDALKENSSVCLFGVTGSGKSSLGNTLIGKDLFSVGHGRVSHTSVCKDLSTTWNGIDLTVIDTPGTKDTGGRDGKNIKNIVDHLKKRQAIGLFLVVLNAGDERLFDQTREMFQLFIDMFPNDNNEKEAQNNMAFVFTHWERTKKKETERKQKGKTEKHRRQAMSEFMKEMLPGCPPGFSPECFFIDNEVKLSEDKQEILAGETELNRLKDFILIKSKQPLDCREMIDVLKDRKEKAELKRLDSYDELKQLEIDTYEPKKETPIQSQSNGYFQDRQMNALFDDYYGRFLGYNPVRQQMSSGHYTKSGLPDQRYKEHWRYNSSGVRLRKDGKPDRRFKRR